LYELHAARANNVLGSTERRVFSLSLAAVSQSLASKPREAEDLAAVFVDFRWGMKTFCSV